MVKAASDKKQIAIELPDEDVIDWIPSREVTQEVLDLLDEGQTGRNLAGERGSS